MELVCRLDCRNETKAMLEDGFVDGFLFKLFLTKWEKVLWREHAAQLALECIQAASLVNISFNKPDFQSVPVWSSALQICAWCAAVTDVTGVTGVTTAIQTLQSHTHATAYCSSSPVLL